MRVSSAEPFSGPPWARWAAPCRSWFAPESAAGAEGISGELCAPGGCELDASISTDCGNDRSEAERNAEPPTPTITTANTPRQPTHTTGAIRRGSRAPRQPHVWHVQPPMRQDARSQTGNHHPHIKTVISRCSTWLVPGLAQSVGFWQIGQNFEVWSTTSPPKKSPAGRRRARKDRGRRGGACFGAELFGCFPGSNLPSLPW